MSFGMFQQTVSADAAMAEYYPPTFEGNRIWDFMVKMKTHTPGLGNLLCTLQYNDGEGPQTLNVACALIAGNYTVAAWPNEWRDTSQDVQLQFTYLGGIVSGTCDVEVQARNA
jgi:hypothetical protein